MKTYSATKTQRHKFYYLVLAQKKIALSAFVPLCLITTFFLLPSCSFGKTSRILKENKCADCHSLNPQKKIANEHKKAPDLFYAGDKFQEKWLTKFLEEPEIIRPAGYITDPGYLKGNPELKSHIRLTKEDALLVSQHLLTLKSGILEPVEIDNQVSNRGLGRGKRMFEGQYGCIACHRAQNLRGILKGGVSGPVLSNTGNRLRGSWVFNKLKNPALFEKKGRMPVYKIPDKEYLMLTAYLMTQLKENERK